MTNTDKTENVNALMRIFGNGPALIGNIHLAPLPGTPRYDGSSIHAITDRALRDLEAFMEGGMTGFIVENHGDIPFLPPDRIGPEIIAALSVIAGRVVDASNGPVGINLLANGVMGALAVAKAADAQFVRVNQWANAYVANEGILDGRAGAALRFRRTIGADNVAVFADVHVKHGAHAMTGDRETSELARDNEFFGADVAIATGNRTADSVPFEEIKSIRAGTTLPVIAGSGMTNHNAASLMQKLDGAIVGSSLKVDGHWKNPVDVERVRRFVEAVKAGAHAQ
jgi:hypothetical protein